MLFILFILKGLLASQKQNFPTSQIKLSWTDIIFLSESRIFKDKENKVE